MNSPQTPLNLPTPESVATGIRNREEMEKHLDGLKPEINAFLFKWLPDSTSIREMERLACGIFDEIHRRWKEQFSVNPGKTTDGEVSAGRRICGCGDPRCGNPRPQA